MYKIIRFIEIIKYLASITKEKQFYIQIVCYVDEKPASSTKSVNLLADLTSRFYIERDAVMVKLRRHDTAVEVQQVLLVSLKLETVRAAREGMFHVSALSTGLAERTTEAVSTR